MAYNQQNAQNQPGYPVQPDNSAYYQQPLPPVNNEQYQNPYYGQPMAPQMMGDNQHSSRPNSGRKEGQSYAYYDHPQIQPNYYQHEVPNDHNNYNQGGHNPYPQNVAPDVNRAVQGESKWKKAT